MVSEPQAPDTYQYEDQDCSFIPVPRDAQRDEVGHYEDESPEDVYDSIVFLGLGHEVKHEVESESGNNWHPNSQGVHILTSRGRAKSHILN